MKVFLAAVLFIGLCVLGLGVSIFFRKNGHFPETDISRNKEMQRRGITCPREDELREQGGRFPGQGPGMTKGDGPGMTKGDCPGMTKGDGPGMTKGGKAENAGGAGSGRVAEGCSGVYTSACEGCPFRGD